MPGEKEKSHTTVKTAEMIQERDVDRPPPGGDANQEVHE
jgi:hypothetical protein